MEEATSFMNVFMTMEYEPVEEVMKYLLAGPHTEYRLNERFREFANYFDQFKEHEHYIECKLLLHHFRNLCLDKIRGVEGDEAEDDESEDEEDEDGDDVAENEETEDEKRSANQEYPIRSLRDRKGHKYYNHEISTKGNVDFGKEADTMNSPKKKQKNEKAIKVAAAAAAAEMEAQEAEKIAAAATRDAEAKRAKAVAAAAKTAKSKKTTKFLSVDSDSDRSDDDSPKQLQPPNIGNKANVVSTPRNKKTPPKTGITPRRKQKTYAFSVKQMKDVATSDKFDLVARRTKELQKSACLENRKHHKNNPKLQFILMTYDEVITNQNNKSSNIRNGRFTFLTCDRFDPQLIGPQLQKIGEEMSKGHKKGDDFECNPVCYENFVRVFGSKRRYRRKGKNKQFKENSTIHK